MYVHYEKFLITMGMQKQAEDRVPGVTDVQKRNPGFKSVVFLRGLKDLTHYLAVRVWESRDAQQAFLRDPDFAELQRKRIPNLYAAPPDSEFFDIAHEEWGKAAPGYAWGQELHLNHGKSRAWEEYAPLLHPAMRASAGFCGVQDLRYWGNGEYCVRMSYWESPEALMQFFATAASVQWRDQMPDDLFHEKPNDQLYQVVHHFRQPE